MMKKSLMKATLAVVFTVVASYGFYAFQKGNGRLSDLALANIECLANNESDNESDHEWTAPRTVRCDLFEGGWHTSSVERICEFCVTPNSCSPVSCGVVFYN